MEQNWTEASLIGALTACARFPFLQPLDCLKTRMQASPTENLTLRVAFRHLRADKGILGVYTGGLPYFLRDAVRQAYRLPMRLKLPPLFEEIISGKPGPISTLSSCLTGVSIGTFETIVFTPVERFKVYLITRRQGETLRGLYRGVGAVWYRQVGSWVVFQVLDKKSKDVMIQLRGTKDLSVLDLVLASFFVSCGNTAVIAPIDTIKTQMQMSRPLASRGMPRAFGVYIRQYGFRALYRGSLPYMIQLFARTLTFSPIVYYYERLWGHR